MTAACMIVHPNSGHITFSGAGHPPLLILRESGEVKPLASQGPPIGILARQECGEVAAELGPNDVALLYTDGLYSVADETGARMTPKQIPALLPKESVSAEDFLNQTLNQVLRYAKGEPLPDDLAAVALRRS